MMLLTNMFYTIEERCYQKSLDNMKYRHHNGFNVFFTPDRGLFFLFGGGRGGGGSVLCPLRTTIKWSTVKTELKRKAKEQQSSFFFSPKTV